MQKSAKPVFASHLQGKNTFALLTDFYIPAAIVSSETAWKLVLAKAGNGNPHQINNLVQVMDARLLGHDNIEVF